MDNPKVSICIPTYNGEKYIKECIDSALNQTYKNFEIIISDNNSNDNTISIIKTISKERNVDIKIYTNDNIGIGKNWNNVIRKANGKYIKFLFQDDLLAPNCLDVFVKHIIYENKNYSIIACQRKIIGEKTKENQYWIEQCGFLQRNIDADKNGNFLFTNKFFKSNLFFTSPINKIGEPTTIMIKKDVFYDIGFFNEDFKQILDYEFYYRALKKYDILVLNHYLASFRLHSQQATNINSKNKISETPIYLNKIVFSQFKWLLPWKLVLKHKFTLTKQKIITFIKKTIKQSK